MKLKAWQMVLVALLIVGVHRINNHQHFSLHFSYDMPQHLVNVQTILATGWMPPPPLDPGNYQAHQAPLFYLIAAAILAAAEPLHLQPNTFEGIMPLVLFVQGMLWSAIVAVFVQRTLRRLPELLQILTICAVLLFPVNTIMTVMFGNDLPVTIFGTLSVMLLWWMCRSGRTTGARLWLATTVYVMLAVAFKLNGVIYLAIYIVVAGGLVLDARRQGDARRAQHIFSLALPGLSLILILYAFNALNAFTYTGNPLSVLTLPAEPGVHFEPGMFFRFDTRIFEMPFAYGPGEDSFWTMQYITVHNDYYNHWNSAQYLALPPDTLLIMKHRYPMPISHFNDAVAVQIIALPISLLMLLAIVRAIWRCIRRPSQAVRSGSLVLLAYVILNQLALIAHAAGYAHIRAAHARYAGFLYGFLLVVGMLEAWQLIGRRSRLVQVCLALVLLAYSVFAFRLMWLP